MTLKGKDISGRGNGEVLGKSKLAALEDSTEPVWLVCVEGLRRQSLKKDLYEIMYLKGDWSGERLEKWLRVKSAG